MLRLGHGRVNIQQIKWIMIGKKNGGWVAHDSITKVYKGSM